VIFTSLHPSLRTDRSRSSPIMRRTLPKQQSRYVKNRNHSYHNRFLKSTTRLSTYSWIASLSRRSPMHRHRFHFRTDFPRTLCFHFLPFPPYYAVRFFARTRPDSDLDRVDRDSRLFIARRMTERIDHELHLASATRNSRIGSFLLFARASGRARALRRVSAKIAAAD